MSNQQIESRSDVYHVASLKNVNSLPEFPRFTPPIQYSSWDYINGLFVEQKYPSALPPLVVAEVSQDDYILLDGRLRKFIALNKSIMQVPVQIVSLDTSNIVVSAFKYMIQLHDALTPIEAAYWMYAIKSFIQYEPIPMPNETYSFDAAVRFSEAHTIHELSKLSNTLDTKAQLDLIANFEQKKTCR